MNHKIVELCFMPAATQSEHPCPESIVRQTGTRSEVNSNPIRWTCRCRRLSWPAHKPAGRITTAPK